MKRLFLSIFSVFVILFSIFAPALIVSRSSEVFSSLSGIKIFLDPGHGGYDPGTGHDGIQEKNINMDIASATFEMAIESGSSAYMSRSGDYDLSGIFSTNHKLDDLKKRVEVINTVEPDVLISLHLNAIKDESIYGPMVYYRHLDLESASLAMCIQDALNELTGLNKITHPERYYLFRKTLMPAVLVECGFLSNAAERKRLMAVSYQQEIAKCIITGVNNYLEKSASI